jgi:hypothetical protein
MGRCSRFDRRCIKLATPIGAKAEAMKRFVRIQIDSLLKFLRFPIQLDQTRHKECRERQLICALQFSKR